MHRSSPKYIDSSMLGTAAMRRVMVAVPMAVLGLITFVRSSLDIATDQTNAAMSAMVEKCAVDEDKTTKEQAGFFHAKIKTIVKEDGPYKGRGSRQGCLEKAANENVQPSTARGLMPLTFAQCDTDMTVYHNNNTYTISTATDCTIDDFVQTANALGGN